MFDVHYHLLFGVDDGPTSIDDSIGLAEASIAEGVTHIVATPHANGRYSFDPAINREKLALLQERFEGRLTLGMGCDFHLSYQNLADLEHDSTKYTINGKQYLLVEFADFGIPHSMSDVLFRMRGSGIVPIITHPERNAELAADPRRLVEWTAGGCLVQVTAGSLCGDLGRKTTSIALDLVKRNLVHVVASDAHSTKWRPPRMRRAYDRLRQQFGEGTAERLCHENPRAIFFGEDVQSSSGKDSDSHNARQPSGFFSRLFGR